MFELEEARGQSRDPRSFSRIMCFKQCFRGPAEFRTGPVVANVINIIMLILNALAMFIFLERNLIWLVSLNIVLGFLTQVLMWCVQCSDPGVMKRN